MRRRAAGGHAASLVDRHVDDHGPRLHELEVVSLDQMGRTCARNQHAADHEIGPRDLLPDRVAVGIEAVDVRRRHVVEIPQPFEVGIEQAHVRTEARSHLGGIGPDAARAEHRHMGRRHARHATQQDAAAHLRLLQILCPLLDAHPPRHLAHRNQQRQSAAVVAERFIGHGGGAGGEKPLRQPPIGGKVKVGEHRLTGADELQLRGLRLLHLHDHVGLTKHLLGRIDEFRPARRIGLVGEARAGPC